MKNIVIAVTMIQVWVPAYAQVLGTWRDSEIAKCNITIKREGTVAKVSQTNCQHPELEGTENYKLFGNNGFKPNPLKVGDRTIKLSWYYKIAKSGDLEVRDAEGGRIQK